MRQRTRGIRGLAFLSVMVGIYSFMAGIALLWGGAIVAFIGNEVGALVFGLGVMFLALSTAAFFTTVGLWTQRSWSWAGATFIFVMLTVLNVVLALAATNFGAVALPLLGSIVGLAYLSRPSTRAQLIGPDEAGASAPAAQSIRDVVETAA